jgi:antitoxin component YwqK of YwqJK toxin-antitoxin module
MGRLFIVFLTIFFASGIFGQEAINLVDAKGRKQGFWRKSDSLGNKLYEGNFIDGIPSDTFRYFYRTGSLKTLSVISGQGKRAKTVSYFPNGRKMASGNYLNEKRDGIWQFFSDGSEKLVSEEFYAEGKIEGNSKVFYPEGGVSEVTNYINGIKDGLWEQYFSDGTIKLRGKFKAGEKHERFQLFYPSGQLRVSGQYNNGHQDGVWNSYDEKGKLVKKETYKKGKLLKTEEPSQK